MDNRPKAASAAIPHNPLEGDKPELTFDLHDGTDEQISIIVVNKDKPGRFGPEYLNICLQSIAITSLNNNYEIIVVDNASGQDTQDFLTDIDGEVTVVRNKENLYWSESCNKGVEAASKNSKYYVFMHSDVVITNPAWLDLLVNVAEAQNAGLVGVEMLSYMMANHKVDFVQEWLMMMSKECWKAVGPWPVELKQVGHSFIMTHRAQSRGYKPQVMRNPVAHHYKVFGLDINEYERFLEQAMVTIPQLLRGIQSEPVNSSFSPRR